MKIESLPPGTTDINTYEAGWGYADSAKILIYGNIIKAVSINGDAGCATDRTFTLSLNPPGTPDEMYISDKGTLPRRSIPYATSTQWKLKGSRGRKAVNVWFKTGDAIQGPFSSSIYFDKICSPTQAAMVSK